MATKGYNQYRGRGRIGKKLLVALLLLILLGACAFLFLQRYIVYGDDGGIHLELPFGREEESEQPGQIPDEEIDIQREGPPAPPPAPTPEPLVLLPLHARELPYNCLYSDPSGYLQSNEAVVVNIKRSDGTISYHTGIDLPNNVLCGNEATRTHLQTLTQSSCYTVARISAMCDNAYAYAVPASALTYPSGGLWVDNYNRCWLDPSREETIEYLCALAKECAELGFDEILLDQLRFPVEGNLNQTTLGADYDRSGAISALVQRVRQAVGPSVAVSVILPGGIGSDASFQSSGLPANVLMEQFDRIYVPQDSWAYYWLSDVLTADFDRSVRLVITTSYATSGSYMIAQ